MSTERKEIFNFAFIDLETTGLPHLEHNKTRITEISITIVESKQIGLGVYPRVSNILNLCLNPQKFISTESTNITGLANDLLENQSPFSFDVVNTINEFLNLQKKPVCFVAHNGNRFDYPILKAEIDRVGGILDREILCIDSLLCFKKLYVLNNEDNQHKVDEHDTSQSCKKPKLETESSEISDEILCSAVEEYEKRERKQKSIETTPIKQIIKDRGIDRPILKCKQPSFKLGDIYKRLTMKEATDAHNAGADVQYLIHCAAHYGESFVQWANENAVLFSDIRPMKTGVKLGF